MLGSKAACSFLAVASSVPDCEYSSASVLIFSRSFIADFLASAAFIDRAVDSMRMGGR